jgi:hypothetical protein
MGTSNRTTLEATSNLTSHGDQRLHVQCEEAPDDGHNSAQNM